jgi:hypothetical protein
VRQNWHPRGHQAVNKRIRRAHQARTGAAQRAALQRLFVRRAVALRKEQLLYRHNRRREQRAQRRREGVPDVVPTARDDAARSAGKHTASGGRERV